jgi:hypothetical protein
MNVLHLAIVPLIFATIPLASAAEPVRVGGYFCDSRDDQMAFLRLRAKGENEIMAANAVNKAAGKQSCADYISVEVIPGREKIEMSSGLVFKVQSFTFLPENKERWAGTLFGSLDQVAEKDI